jgi:hypothetical protein
MATQHQLQYVALRLGCACSVGARIHDDHGERCDVIPAKHVIRTDACYQNRRMLLDQTYVIRTDAYISRADAC